MSSVSPFVMKPGQLRLADIRSLLELPRTIQLDFASRAEIIAGSVAIDRIVARGDAVYGLNTGFGKLAKTRIADDKLRQLQSNIVLSHAAGIGAPLDDRIVRLVLILKANGLARGHSGVRPEVVEMLLKLANAGIYPLIPSKGSVGASGDLAPLAHLSMVLMGEGEARVDGKVLPARHALAEAGLVALKLGPKEGLALLNGTQVSTSLAITALLDAEDLFRAALMTGAMAIDAAKGSDTPFDPRLHVLRGHRGQIDCAAAYRGLLKGSQIRDSHRIDDDRVQDPYCLRCQPQVMGACLDQMRHVAQVLEIEANAVSDNPILFPDTDELISGGNFHAEPVALAADSLAVAIAEIGALSERRIALLIDASMSGLPPFLVRESGINSGFMLAQVTAAALASENKSLAHPASVDSLPTSANQEDHVSMATFGARRLHDMVANTRGIIAIELLATAQGIDFHAPLQTAPMLMQLHSRVRERVSFYAQDRYFAPDITAITELLQGSSVKDISGKLLPELMPRD